MDIAFVLSIKHMKNRNTCWAIVRVVIVSGGCEVIEKSIVDRKEKTQLLPGATAFI